MVDRNLFLHDLAVVAILKNEGAYLKEWLDYHLLAGVDHFYLYDNDSTDNQREVAAPYVEAGIVDYFNAPGKTMQYAVYNDAVKRFKFHCRYMTFIDGDEFVYPKTNQSIAEVVDEVLSHDENAASLSINWQVFGSNGHDKADYSRKVLERFTRRAPKDFGEPKGSDAWYDGNTYVKTVVNPRRINFVDNPHFLNYFDGFHSVDENGNPTKIDGHVYPVTAEKIAVNHYYTKSREEYLNKINRGRADVTFDVYNMKIFEINDRNDVFDDGILRYRDERKKTFQLPDKSRAVERLLNALTVNLSPTLIPNTPPKFFAGKMETFLTCREVAAYLKTQLADDALAKAFEEAALKAILKTFNEISLADVRLFLRELPKLLALPYPAVDELRADTIERIPQMQEFFHSHGLWKDFVELDYLQDILKLGG